MLRLVLPVTRRRALACALVGALVAVAAGCGGGSHHAASGKHRFVAKTGKALYRYRNSSLIMAPPITYTVRGKQYIAVDMTAGTSTVELPGFGALTTATKDKLTVFSLG